MKRRRHPSLLARQAAALADHLAWGGLRGLWLFAANVARSLATRKGETFTVRLRGQPPLKLRAGTTDLAVFRQVEIRGEYGLPPREDARLAARYEAILAGGARPVVIDGGANVGLFARQAADRFPEAAVVSVEPEPANAALARENTAAFPTVALHEGAIWRFDGRLRLSNPDAPAWGFACAEAGEGEAADAPIPCHTIDSLVATVEGGRLFLLKLDIEGGEREALSVDGRFWADRPVVMIEPHDWMAGRSATLGPLLARPEYRTGDVVVVGENLVFFPAGTAAEGAAAGKAAATP